MARMKWTADLQRFGWVSDCGRFVIRSVCINPKWHGYWSLFDTATQTERPCRTEASAKTAARNLKGQAMKTKRDGGPYYGRKVPRAEVLRHARPERRPQYGNPAKTHYVWWASGGDNWGVDLPNGVLPFEVSKVLGLATAVTPPGSGGRWYETEADAMNALQAAMDKTEGVAEF